MLPPKALGVCSSTKWQANGSQSRHTKHFCTSIMQKRWTIEYGEASGQAVLEGLAILRAVQLWAPKLQGQSAGHQV